VGSQARVDGQLGQYSHYNVACGDKTFDSRERMRDFASEFVVVAAFIIHLPSIIIETRRSFASESVKKIGGEKTDFSTQFFILFCHNLCGLSLLWMQGKKGLAWSSNIKPIFFWAVKLLFSKQDMLVVCINWVLLRLGCQD
jgi:hypothetical protein